MRLCSSDRLPRNQEALLVYSNIPMADHLPESARRKYCLYVTKRPDTDLSDLVISKLRSSIIHKRVCYTVRRGRAPGPGKTKHWPINRERILHTFRRGKEMVTEGEDEGEPLMSDAEFRCEIYDWIKALEVAAMET